MLKTLLSAGVTVVAEAAFQDRLWRPNLEPLTVLAGLRVIRCTVDPAVAHTRISQRARDSAHRAAHGDHELLEAIAAGQHRLDSWVPIRMDVPTLVVDTTDGYEPAVSEIAAFVTGPAGS